MPVNSRHMEIIIFITSAKEVMFSSAIILFVCLLTRLGLAKTSQPIFTKFGGKVAHWPTKKRLDFGDNPNHATLEFRARIKS